ncbi:unnamed protein product [Lactuca saligna]|uniref:Jacalin-type lectin domain-containing protein n=1 Tax=Lactuca saligna TaxID=75948 RepID=A0AA35YXQ0_LACSI|nr:unnamed protein product [Lactuca saligna]
MAANGVLVGPWGGKGGVNPWIFIPNGRISQICVSASGCIDSIRFTYIDHQGVQKHSERYGGDGGLAQTVTFIDDEHFIGITGTVGVYEGYTVITSLSFLTNIKNYGPYGTNQGTSFSLPVTKGSFVGLSGNYGAYIDSFSVILQSSSVGNIFSTNMASNKIHVGPWGGKGGVKPWTFIPNGRISKICISASGCVDSIRFTYIDHQGVQKQSERYGGDGGSAHTLTLVDDEHFIGITGTVGVYERYTVITSLSFLTNRKNYGPYGTNQGTSFSLPVAIVSFFNLLPLRNTFSSNTASNRIHVGPWGGNGGVKPWTFIPNGRISQIRISAFGCVDSIRFTYIDHQGVQKYSERYGGDGGSLYKVTFVDDEHLSGITGTVGIYERYTVITSLSFLTNKKNYGPYGTNQGTSFSLPVAKGSFSGFSGNYGAYIDTFSVILQSSSLQKIFSTNMASNGIHVGPWGGNGRVKPWTFIPNGRISKICINASGCVDSITFTYIDDQGVQKQSERYGGDGGSPHTVTFVDDEHFIGISGTVGVYEHYTVITSLSFVTNKKNYGPYGTNQGTGFSLPVAKGSFGGFKGNYGAYIDSFSVILQSSSPENIFKSNMVSNEIHVGPWGGNGGVKPWTFIPNGRIFQIRINASGCVDSIRFTYIDHQGVKKHSERYGGDGGSSHMVTFVDDEHFIGITGTVGVYEGYTVIRSMSFLTNKKKYGPYGTNQGTSFSLPVAKGSFSGFSGNYGAYIDSFSVILQSSSFGKIFTSNMESNRIHVGPWGGNGGIKPWTFIPNGRISQIRISASGCVDSIKFIYIDNQGVQKYSERYGGDGGSTHIVTFVDDEHFIGITGTIGVYERYTVITSLSFLTNKKNYGPYGTNKGTSFSLPVAKGCFGGFSGNYGAYIDSFSVILQSSSTENIFKSNMVSNEIRVGPWGGNGGVKPWTFIPNGRIFQICINASGCVDSIRFTYIDHQGVQKHSERYGGDGGSSHMVTFVNDEHIVGITGTVGVYDGYTVITSMSFITNKNNYGPYGTNQGTSFSLPVSKGSFCGFSGNYGAYIDSFSVILQSSSFGNMFTSNMESNRIHVGPWGGNGGVNPWTFIPNGRISQIRISGSGCVDSIRFAYIDNQGVQKYSEKYGGDGGSTHIVTFVDDEHFIGITGTIGVYERYTVITSLLFLTNKKNYGSFFNLFPLGTYSTQTWQAMEYKLDLGEVTAVLIPGHSSPMVGFPRSVSVPLVV